MKTVTIWESEKELNEAYPDFNGEFYSTRKLTKFLSRRGVYCSGYEIILKLDPLISVERDNIDDVIAELQQLKAHLDKYRLPKDG